ncbi:MAG: HNH endonuclease [Bacteroidetes bacterium]|nr:HNH endonuclease [Bacteroidota bacterium]
MCWRGRNLEPQFTQLDHLQPRSEGVSNFVTNRILICEPCNRKKSNNLTLIGLHKLNRVDDWMKDVELAKDAKRQALRIAEKIKRQMV